MRSPHRHCQKEKAPAWGKPGQEGADRSGLRLVGFIFASVTFAVMLTTTMVIAYCSDCETTSPLERRWNIRQAL